MRMTIIAMVALVAGCASVQGDGLVTVPSAYDVPATVSRLEAALEQKGMRVFNTIDHGAGASSVGQSLRPTVLVVFGNPKVGSELMRCAQRAGIDLPMKALVYEDDGGKTFLAYNSPAWMNARHGLADCEAVLGSVERALAGFANAATRYQPPDIMRGETP